MFGVHSCAIGAGVDHAVGSYYDHVVGVARSTCSTAKKLGGAGDCKILPW